MIKVPKEINLLSPISNETLTKVKTNKFGDVTCVKYKSVTSRVAIDCVHAAPEQVKIVPPKEKKKRVPPSAQENEAKHQRVTITLLKDKVKILTEYTMRCNIGSIRNISITGT